MHTSIADIVGKPLDVDTGVVDNGIDADTGVYDVTGMDL